MAEGNSVADDLDAAWDKLEAGGTGTEPENQPAQETEAEPETEVDAEAPPTESEDAPTEAPEPPAAETGQKKAVQPKPGKPGKATDGKAPANATPEPGPKAPQSWPVKVRQHWDKLPPEVKAQVDKTEREVKRVLQDTVAARRVAAELEKTLTPYKAFMRGPPMQEIDGLFKTVALLRTGDDETRAAIAANVITNFHVPIRRLAELLGGTAEPSAEGEATQPPPAPQKPQTFRDPEFAAFKSNLERQAQASKQQQQQIAEAERRRHREELQAFADSGKAEFFYDVIPQMEIVQQAARAEGKQISIEQLYEKACLLNDDVRPLWEQRQAANKAAANAARASTQPRTRVSTSSVRHEPTSPATGKRELSLKDELTATWDRLAARR